MQSKIKKLPKKYIFIGRIRKLRNKKRKVKILNLKIEKSNFFEVKSSFVYLINHLHKKRRKKLNIALSGLIIFSKLWQHFDNAWFCYNGAFTHFTFYRADIDRVIHWEDTVAGDQVSMKFGYIVAYWYYLTKKRKKMKVKNINKLQRGTKLVAGEWRLFLPSNDFFAPMLMGGKHLLRMFIHLYNYRFIEQNSIKRFFATSYVKLLYIIMREDYAKKYRKSAVRKSRNAYKYILNKLSIYNKKPGLILLFKKWVIFRLEIAFLLFKLFWINDFVESKHQLLPIYKFFRPSFARMRKKLKRKHISHKIFNFNYISFHLKNRKPVVVKKKKKKKFIKMKKVSLNL